MTKLADKILSKKAEVAIIGLGYVGLPLAVEVANAGFNVWGYELDEEKISLANSGKTYINDVSDEELLKIINSGKFKATSKTDCIKECDIVIICVPTPLTPNKEPDMKYIDAATKTISENLRKGQMVILESTTYPGTTTERILPMLESTGLKVGKDFHLVFSPERVDPGNKKFKTKDITKVVGGVTPKCTDLALKFYNQVVAKTFPVSSPNTAEMTKIFENTFRGVNIALVNEMTMICNKLGINVWEVIEAAATKNFGFMAFYPGPGVGGHCIPLDPFYLAWKAREHNLYTHFIELAGEINDQMPLHVVQRATLLLNNAKKSVNGSKILILGVAYKKDISDVRESPALHIIPELQKLGAKVFYNDPYVPDLNEEGIDLQSSDITDDLLKAADCVIIITNHSSYNYDEIADKTDILFDTRNATKGLNKTNIVKL